MYFIFIARYLQFVRRDVRLVVPSNMTDTATCGRHQFPWAPVHVILGCIMYTH